MKTPTQVLSHCLAHGVGVNEHRTRKNLETDRVLGYAGMVVVAALIEPSCATDSLAAVFRETGSFALICGFVPGNGPDPFEEPKLVLESLRTQARVAATFAEKRCGEPVMVGPMHAWHMRERPVWEQGKFERWLDALNALGKEFGITLLLEPLNEVEDKTPQPFNTLHKAMSGRDMLDFHFDTGHAYARDFSAHDSVQIAKSIGFFEFANVGRWPLDEMHGLNVKNYKKVIARLPEDCIVGVEPFDQSVINAFGLKGLCPTTVPGPEALRRDALYLQQLGVMAKAA